MGDVAGVVADRGDVAIENERIAVRAVDAVFSGEGFVLGEGAAEADGGARFEDVEGAAFHVLRGKVVEAVKSGISVDDFGVRMFGGSDENGVLGFFDGGFDEADLLFGGGEAFFGAELGENAIDDRREDVEEAAVFDEVIERAAFHHFDGDAFVALAGGDDEGRELPAGFEAFDQIGADRVGEF